MVLRRCLSWTGALYLLSAKDSSLLDGQLRANSMRSALTVSASTREQAFVLRPSAAVASIVQHDLDF
jgi:hypothetical protein